MRRLGATLLAFAAAATFLAPPLPVLAQAARSPGNVGLADLGYNDDTLLGRSFSSSYFLPGPGDYPLANSGTLLTLVFSATNLAGPNSALSVAWNNVPVADIPLANKEQRQEVSIAIPADRIDPSVNQIAIRGDLDRETGVCRSDEEGMHFTIYKETAIRYALTDTNPHPKPATPDLSRYPLPFFDLVPSVDSRLTFVLPPNPSPGVLQAAGTLAIGLGRSAGSRSLDTRVASDTGQLSADQAQSNLIYVGQAKDLPSLLQIPRMPLRIEPSGIISKDDAAVNPDSGVLMEAPSPLNPGRMVLAVTGQTDAAVVQAATALGTRRTARVLGGSSAIIDHLDTDPTPAVDAVASRRVVTLSDLGRNDETVNGPGDHIITFKVELPGVPQGGNGLALNLVSSHSPLIDGGNSSLRVTLNGVPLSSSGLKNTGQPRDVTQLRLPASALRSGVNQFEVTFTLRLAVVSTNACGALPVEQAWAVLHADTSLQLPTRFGTSTESDLAGYPYPFISGTGLAKTTFVVPSKFDIAPFIRYCTDLGRSLGQDSPPPQVVSAGDFKPTETDANLIVWGTPEQNPVLGSLNDSLPLAITPGQPQRYAFANSVLISVRDSSSLGVIQELPSPWTQNRQILVVSGTTAEAVPLAVAALGQPGLSNNLALVSAAAPASITAAPQLLGSAPRVDVTTYKVRSKQQAATAQSTIELLPVALAAAFGLLALVMAASMAYEAFVREPRGRR